MPKSDSPTIAYQAGDTIDDGRTIYEIVRTEPPRDGVPFLVLRSVDDGRTLTGRLLTGADRPAATAGLRRRFQRYQTGPSRLIARLADIRRLDDGTVLCVYTALTSTPIMAYCRAENPSLERRLALFAQLCAMVAELHDAGLPHSALSPATVCVHVNGGMTLLDTGLGLVKHAVGWTDAVKSDAAAFAADMHALGVVLGELLHDQPISQSLADIIARATGTAAGWRYASVKGLAAAVAAAEPAPPDEPRPQFHLNPLPDKRSTWVLADCGDLLSDVALRLDDRDPPLGHWRCWLSLHKDWVELDQAELLDKLVAAIGKVYGLHRRERQRAGEASYPVLRRAAFTMPADGAPREPAASRYGVSVGGLVSIISAAPADADAPAIDRGPAEAALIGGNLRVLRMNIELSHDEVAAAVGLPHATIVAVEDGKYDPGSPEVETLRAFYHKILA